MDLFDAAAAREARDKALAEVTANSGPWASEALNAILGLPTGFTGTAEAIRLHLTDVGLSKPHHHNAWGALIRMAVKRGLLEWTGKLDQMRTVKSHARRTPVYRRTRALVAEISEPSKSRK